MEQLLKDLIKASRAGPPEAVAAQLDKGIDVNAKDKRGDTALMYATSAGRTAVVKFLLGKGADVNAKNNLGQTALMIASKKGKHNGLKVLLAAKGVDINAQTDDGTTALMYASQENDTEAAEMLLEQVADVNAQDKYGDTALMLASKNGHAPVANLLLEQGADVNAQNKYGTTALILASERGHDTVVELLLEEDADTTIKNKANQTALDVASTDKIRRMLSPKPAFGHAAPPALQLADGAEDRGKPAHPDKLPESFIAQQTAFLTSLTADERALLKSYTSHGDRIVNPVLRGTPIVDLQTNLLSLPPRKLGDEKAPVQIGKTVPVYVSQLMAVLKKAPILEEKLTVFRGVKVTKPNTYVPSSGNDILSTSYSEGIAQAFVDDLDSDACCFVTVVIEPGVRVLWIQKVSAWPAEKEIIIIPPFTETVVSHDTPRNMVVTISPRAKYERKPKAGRKTRKAKRKARNTRRHL